MPTPAYIVADWPAPANIKAFTSCRTGGVSGAPYDSFNIAQHVGDDSEWVHVNRSLLPNHQQFVWLNQTHSTICLNLDKPQNISHQPIEADASYSTIKNRVCAVMTADCLPVLLCDQAGTCVAAIHAGWRGLADGIIEKMVAQMPVVPTQLMAWMGPAISQKHFEVGAEVKQMFSDYPHVFIKNVSSTQDRYFADLYQIAKDKLLALGVTDVFGGKYCTYAQDNLFFSHRRTSHQSVINPELSQTTGRMVSAIYIT